MILLLLVRWGVMQYSALYLSDFFNEYRPLYIEGLWQISANGDWKRWIQFFLDAVMLQAEETALKIRALLNLREAYRQTYQVSRSSAGLLSVIDRLFAFPALSIPTVERELSVTYPTAAKWIHSLEKDGILTELTGQRKNRLYLAGEVISILNTPPFYARADESESGDPKMREPS